MSAHSTTSRFPTFQEAFCHRYGCAAESFPRGAFFKGVPAVRLPLVAPVFLVAPATFDLDIDIIKILGKTRSKAEFSQQLDEFHNALRATRSWSKRWLGMRMSGAKLMDLRDELEPLIDATLPVDATGEAAGASPVRTPIAPPMESAHAPTESRALTSRKLRQAADAVMGGKPLAEALAAAGLNEEQFLKQLAGAAQTNPTMGWLRTRLLEARRLPVAEAEIVRLNRELEELRTLAGRTSSAGNQFPKT